MFTTRDVAPGLLVPYLGRIIFLDNTRDSGDAYTFRLDHECERWEAVLDANPAGMADLMVGSFANEIDAGCSDASVRYNAAFVQAPVENLEELGCPAYPGRHGGVFILFTEAVSAKSEVFLRYSVGGEQREGYTARDAPLEDDPRELARVLATDTLVSGAVRLPTEAPLTATSSPAWRCPSRRGWAVCAAEHLMAAPDMAEARELLEWAEQRLSRVMLHALANTPAFNCWRVLKNTLGEMRVAMR